EPDTPGHIRDVMVGVDRRKPYIAECYPACAQATGRIKDVRRDFVRTSYPIYVRKRSHQNGDRIQDAAYCSVPDGACLNIACTLDLKIHGIAIVILSVVRVPQMNLRDQRRSSQVDRHRLTDFAFRAEPITRNAAATLLLVNLADDTIGDVAPIILICIVP